MTEIYGRQWEASYGPMGGPAYATWSAGLADIPLEAIRAGLNLCAKDGEKYPPNLPEFRGLCGRHKKDGWEHSTQHPRNQVFTGLALPRKKNPNSEASQACFSKFRELYGSKK